MRHFCYLLPYHANVLPPASLGPASPLASGLLVLLLHKSLLPLCIMQDYYPESLSIMC